MAGNDDKVAAGKNRLKKTSSYQVRRRFLQQARLAKIPVFRPLREQLSAAFRSIQSRVLCKVGLRNKSEAARAPVSLGGLKHGLKVLALVLRHARVAKPTDLGMLPKYPKQRRSAAPVKPAKENKLVAVRFIQGHCCSGRPRAKCAQTVHRPGFLDFLTTRLAKLSVLAGIGSFSRKRNISPIPSLLDSGLIRLRDRLFCLKLR